MSGIVICSNEGNISLSQKRERILSKLVEGHKHATELKHLLQNQNQNLPPTSSSAEALLISKILRSFTETLSDLEDSSAPASASALALASSLNNWSHQLVVVANSYSTNNDLKSEGSSESSKRSSSSAVPNKDRRGTYKRRKTEETWSNVSPNTDDDCSWRKYGQKEILNSKFPRSYYRCTKKFDQGCKATKQVQRIQDNPVLYQITYIGRHTCKESLKASQMMMITTNLLNPKDHHQTPPANAIIKQEDTTPNDDPIIAEKLDGNLWSDLKDFEITNPPSSADNNFGVFSSYNYCTTGFQFDDHHHDI